jgi:hypothetical protein
VNGVAGKEGVVMTAEPHLRICRFSQLSPGDLFVYVHDNGSCIALKVVDPTANDEPLLLPFGPQLPSGLDRSNLLSQQSTDVISFGKAYVLKLPARAEGWSRSEPDQETLCILATDESYFIRANSAGQRGEFRPCYVDLMTGRIHAKDNGWQGEFIRPRGASAVAVEWELMTTEPEPRLIFAQRPIHAEPKPGAIKNPA